MLTSLINKKRFRVKIGETKSNSNVLRVPYLIDAEKSARPV